MIRLLAIALLITASGFESCGGTPEPVTNPMSPEEARDFCFSRWQDATSAAASCAEKCVEEDLSDLCARTKCHSELGKLRAWSDMEQRCWAKYTPKLYHPRPSWPSAKLVPIAE